MDVGWGLLGRTFTERRGVGRVGSKKSLDWANKVFWAGNPRGSDFEALKAVPAIGRIPRFWALSNGRRRNRAQVVGFVRQSHSDCALAFEGGCLKGGSHRQYNTSRSYCETKARTLSCLAGTSGGHRSPVPPQWWVTQQVVTSRLLQGGGYRERRLGSVYSPTFPSSYHARIRIATICRVCVS